MKLISVLFMLSFVLILVVAKEVEAETRIPHGDDEPV
jgi:hypothetical protein